MASSFCFVFYYHCDLSSLPMEQETILVQSTFVRVTGSSLLKALKVVSDLFKKNKKVSLPGKGTNQNNTNNEIQIRILKVFLLILRLAIQFTLIYYKYEILVLGQCKNNNCPQNNFQTSSSTINHRISYLLATKISRLYYFNIFLYRSSECKQRKFLTWPVKL